MVSDAQGRFQIVVFPDVVNRLCARADGYRFRQEDCATLDLRTEPPPAGLIELGPLEAEEPSLVLSVVPPPGVPVDRVEVRYHDGAACDGEPQGGLAFAYGVPFPGRHYLDSGLPSSGAGVVTLRSAATGPVCFPIQLTPSAQTRDLGVYTLQPPAPVTYTGRLFVSGTEAPVLNAEIRALDRVTSTDGEGRFSLALPAADEIRTARLSVTGFFDSDPIQLPGMLVGAVDLRGACVVDGRKGVGRTPIVEIETDALGRLRRQFYDRKSRATAVGLALLPGGGHIYQDRVWMGVTIAALEVTQAGLFAWQYLAARDTEDACGRADTAQRAQALREEGDGQDRNAQILLGALIGVHVLQMVHAGFLEPPEPNRTRVFMSAGPSSAGVSLQWAF